jgi:hypothetical protein
MAKTRDGASVKSSTPSFKSLTVKASTTIKAIKRKATELLSPKKKKKSKRLPSDGDGSSIDSNDPKSHPPSESSSQHHSNGSVIDISDEDSEDALSE